uniref:Uncharacterized protein n=1 Tax=Arundo donax TaxID=35708 RepID=A0A0A9EX16_ARUDO
MLTERKSRCLSIVTIANHRRKVILPVYLFVHNIF